MAVAWKLEPSRPSMMRPAKSNRLAIVTPKWLWRLAGEHVPVTPAVGSKWDGSGFPSWAAPRCVFKGVTSKPGDPDPAVGQLFQAGTAAVRTAQAAVAARECRSWLLGLRELCHEVGPLWGEEAVAAGVTPLASCLRPGTKCSLPRG